jgi:perosamine synthetase
MTAIIPLTSPCLDEDDLQAMQEAVRRGAITEGEITRSFEEDISQFLGVSGAVATNSCTSALVLALAALEIGPGDEVALPSYTCLAVLNAVVQAGATPRLADNCCNVADMDYNVTAETLRVVTTPRTKAIIVPHMFGVPADLEPILGLGLPVIEDITLSLGATYHDKPVGAWGDIGVCSFHASKMIACGEGGVFASKNPELVAKARYLNGWAGEQPAARLSNEVERYRLRYNFHMSDVAAALGRSQLRKLPDFIRRRRGLATRYTTQLQTIRGLEVPAVDARSNVFQRFLVAILHGNVVDVIRRFAQVGIEVGRGVYPALHQFLAIRKDVFPMAEWAVRSLLSIPIHPALTQEQAEKLLRTSDAIFSGRNPL